MSESKKKVQERIGYEQLRLYWPYKVQWLEEVRITRQINEHAKLYISGVIPEEEGPGILHVQAEGEPIVLRQLDEMGKSVRRLFHGVMTSLTIHLVGGIYRFELEAISNTYQLDIEVSERAFQNRAMSYGELVKYVMKAYTYSDVIDNVTENTQLGELVLQYRETDWMFLRRLASRFGTVLVPEVTAASPKLFFGLPMGKLWKWPLDRPYHVKKEMGHLNWHGDEQHRYIVQSSKGTKGALIYTMESYETYALGDKVEMPDGKELTVTQAESRLESGLLMTTYRMMLEDHIRVPRSDLLDVIGLSLYGEVTRIIGDRVQMELYIEDGPIKPESSCPYPLATSYVAEGHSGLYLMPEIGDTVELYIPGSRESKAYVRNAVPEGKRSASGGTQHKMWSHPDGPSIGMSSDEVTVQAGTGLVITLNDQGVVMQSAGNISIQGGSLSLKAGQIEATAPEAIWLLGGGSSFILDGQADVRAGLLQQEGSHKAPVVVADLPPEPEPPLIPLEQYEAAQAAAAAEAAAMQPSVVNMKVASLFGAAVAMAGMIPVLGMLGGAPAVAAQAVAVGAAAIGMISGIPSTGSFKPSALQLLNRLKDGFVGMLEGEEGYKRQLLGKVVSAARELTTATSFLDFVKKLHQQDKEISQMYYQIPGYTREKWAHQQIDQELKEALVHYGKVQQNDIEYELFFGPYHNGIARDIGRIDITAEELGDYNYWQKQNLTVEQKKYLARRIMAPMSEEELSTLMGEFEQHEMTMKGLDGEFNGFTGRVGAKKGSSGVPESSDHPGTTGSPSAASKGTTMTDKPATSKTKTFVKKSKDVIVKAVSDYYKESQIIRFQPWGNLGNNKPKESGSAGEVSSGGKTSSNAGNKSSDGAGTSSSSNGHKPNQTPSSSKKSQSSGETNSTGSSSGTGKKPSDGEGTGSSGSGKKEDPTPNTSKKTQTSGEADTTGSNTGTGKKSSEGEGTNSSSTNKKENQIPNSHNQWKQDSSKKKGKDKDDKKKKEEEKRKREEEERQKSESEAEGTGDVPKVSHGKVFPTRVIDLETEGFIIDKVKVLRSKLSNRIKGDLNFAYAKVEIEGIDKNEFYSHSSLNGDNKEKTYADYSLKPTKPKYEATEAPDRSGNVRLRDNDTEYKILNDLASRLDKLSDPSKARGKIKLFTELDTCGSCSRIIGKFHKDYPNIDIEVIHNGDKIVEP
ncbi:deaminase domain-containing protein [Paenibacillus sp. NPDC056933]|uniref:deaminase domain-containing protein n=1 Tax=Paenibacillus sp. NPDC056933 TaxID=3345968 RepID=UPI00363633F2